MKRQLPPALSPNAPQPVGRHLTPPTVAQPRAPTMRPAAAGPAVPSVPAGVNAPQPVGRQLTPPMVTQPRAPTMRPAAAGSAVPSVPAGVNAPQATGTLTPAVRPAPRPPGRQGQAKPAQPVRGILQPAKVLGGGGGGGGPGKGPGKGGDKPQINNKNNNNNKSNGQWVKSGDQYYWVPNGYDLVGGWHPDLYTGGGAQNWHYNIRHQVTNVTYHVYSLGNNWLRLTSLYSNPQDIQQPPLNLNNQQNNKNSSNKKT